MHKISINLLLIILGFKGYAQSIKEVRLGNQIVMSENLSVDRFRNGDPIPYAGSKEEWTHAGQNKQPAWCYESVNRGNNKLEKLYNWYAVNDPRGIAPIGWKIPTNKNWNDIQIFSDSPPSIGGPAKRNADGTFYDELSNYGSWWSLDNTSQLSSIHTSLDILMDVYSLSYYEIDKGYGLSVLCFKDSGAVVELNPVHIWNKLYPGINSFDIEGRMIRKAGNGDHYLADKTYYTKILEVFYYNLGPTKKAKVVLARYLYDNSINRFEDCHACSPTFEVATFVLEENAWVLNDFNADWISIGSWGEPGIIKKVKFGQIQCLVTEYFYGNQGEFETIRDYYNIDNLKKIKSEVVR